MMISINQIPRLASLTITITVLICYFLSIYLGHKPHFPYVDITHCGM